MSTWQFWIDVGGTFTDCLAISPLAASQVIKVLSSGRTKCRLMTWNSVTATSARGTLSLPNAPSNFWRGYQLDLLDENGEIVGSGKVTSSQTDGSVEWIWETSAKALPPTGSSCRAELSSGEGAPLLAIRTALGLGLDEPIPAIALRLGTTRGTNALLTRSGAQVGFVTTRGFRDILKIANQDRPNLFELAIRKPSPLFAAVVEIDERLDANGQVLQEPNDDQIRTALLELQAARCESLAICLLHAFANPAHEERVARMATELGFRHISVSSRLSPLIKIVPRGDTTVMDAYLNPVLRDYVEQLLDRLPGSDVRFMTSSGSLVTGPRFSGKECVLSGPAGGVIGFARAAELAGKKHAIGFDMGGTSTDVSRFDGRFEYEFETMKAGVRIVTPMLAIETVAAGGGSVCGFDGVKLFVGPESAGSHPGPACYGRGGPLTVTDCNAFLGRIPLQEFPFELDLTTVRHRLEDLVAAIARSPLGKKYTPEELAAGFLEIANAAMARAIRKVSTAKGYDPADYVLVPFGGAGGQHACSIAKLLRMQQILAHPWAGILSAYGIGHADVRRVRQQNLLQAYQPTSWQELQPTIQALAQAARDDVLAEGVEATDLLHPEVTLELRYLKVEATISIPAPPDKDFARAYAQRHQQLYGYVREGRGLEIVSIRVEVAGRQGRPLIPILTDDPRTGPLSSAQTQSFWTRDGVRHAPVFTRHHLRAGDEINGPAIISESTSTLVVDEGFKATILAGGEVLLKPLTLPHALPSDEVAEASVPLDPIRLELFHQTFTSFAEQMGLTLQNTSVSTNVKERLDFSCAIFDARGGLVVNAPHIPVHLGAMGETVRCLLSDNPNLAPGDVYVTNDPYRGGSHLPDVTVITPVHHPETHELLFLTASRAHHAEIGGIVPGSMPPFSRQLGEEGVLIRNFRLIHAGISREDDLAALLASGPYPSRNIPDNLADLRAQVAANQLGVRLLEELIVDQGTPTVLAYMGYLQQAASLAMRQTLARLGNGTYAFKDHLDDGSPICVQIQVDGETATIDFTGTGPVLSSNLNANRAIVTAAVMYVLRCLLGNESNVNGSHQRTSEEKEQTKATQPHDLPLNGGVLEPITIILPECLLNPSPQADPALSPAMVGGNVETSQRVVDVLLGALQLAAASQGTMNNLTFGDSTFGYYETICGGSGATPFAEGVDAVHTHMTNTRLTDPEILERRYPVRLHEFSIRQGSGGAGKHRGGHGIRRIIEFLRPVRLSLLTERRGPFAPYGLNGGSPGKLGRNTLITATGIRRDLGAKASLDVSAGDVLEMESPGGGGWGCL